MEFFRHVTIVHQTKDLHTTDYTQLYDFLKYNQKEVDDQRAERLAKTHDPLALMANSNNPFNYPVLLNHGYGIWVQGQTDAAYVGAYGGNQFRHDVQMSGKSANGLIDVPGITNSESKLGNEGIGHLARKRYSQTQGEGSMLSSDSVLIAQKEEARNPNSKLKSFDLMAAAADLDLKWRNIGSQCKLHVDG
ncbi:hypothetical protein Tco_0816329 [Tanacetum coccineum]